MSERVTSGHAERTIFALATPSGRGAIAIMRLSGSRCRVILDALCRGQTPPPRRASLRSLWAADDLLDRAIVLWLPGPHSYTGEDCAELHLHGGTAVIEAVADELIALEARPAEPGEFTRRAFHGGRLDILEAEGVSDLIDSETQAQRRQALRQMEGALSQLYHGWAERLRLALARQEAFIDFPEEDLPAEAEDALLPQLKLLLREMEAHLASGGPGERLRRGLIFAVIGAPNVGKSSLVNALAERDAAIVSSRAGTTRDALEVRVVLGEVPVTLIDTAGLREATDDIEAEGIRRALRHAEQSDLVLRVIDPCTSITAKAGAELVICNKIDTAPAPHGSIGVSAITGCGLAELRGILAEHARSLTARGGAAPLTRARHQAGIRDACLHLAYAVDAHWVELRAEELRLAMLALGRLTGAVSVEDLLDAVFSEFCIGK